MAWPGLRRARLPDQRRQEQPDPFESRSRRHRLIELAHRLRRDYEACFEGRPVQGIWDRVIGDRIRGVSENYLQTAAPATGSAARTVGGGCLASCIFCRLIADPGFSALYRDDDVIAFDDRNPQAPVHFLVVPRKHVETISELNDEHLLGRIFAAAHHVARQRGVGEGGYRLVLNHGPNAGQTVYHVHLHVLGGRQLTWPPG